MNKNVLIGAAVIAAAVAVGAFVTGTRSEAEKTEIKASEERLFPKLLDNADSIAKVEIRDSSDTLTLIKQNDLWTLQEAKSYPAKMDGIRELVINMGELKKLEAKTAKEDSYARIEVEDVKAGAKSKQVTLFDDKGSAVASLILGKERFGQGTVGKSNQFVRVVNDKQSWLVEGSVRVYMEKSNWLDTTVTNIPADRVRSVVIQHPDGEKVDIVKEAESDTIFKLNSLPVGRELQSEARPNEIQYAFNNVRFDEVEKRDSLKLDGTPIVTTMTTFDGLKLEAKVFDVNGMKYSVFEASVDEPAIEKINADRKAKAEKEQKDKEAASPEPTKDAATAGDASKELDVKLVKVEDIRKEADTINKLVSGWAYALPTWAQERMIRRNEYYLKAVEAVGPEAPKAADTETSPMVSVPIPLPSTDSN